MSMSIDGLSHITLVVKDLDRAAMFFCEGLGGQEVYDSAAKSFSLSREKFFLVGGVWMVAMEGEPTGDQGYQHVAFRVGEDDLLGFVGKLTSIGVIVDKGRSRVEGEGKSVYFHDFDGHLFELHTGTLQERLELYS